MATSMPSPLSKPFAWDMTGDGAITITDVWQWVGWVFPLPGDFVIWAFVTWPPLVPIGRFFELSQGGWVSGIISAWVWLWGAFITIGLCMVVWESVSGER